MKVRVIGIELLANEGTKLADLWEHIMRQSGTVYECAGLKRMVFIKEEDGLFNGLLITIKDHKKFIELFNGKDGIEINSRDVSEGSDLAEFNFFKLSKKTGRGIYQHYHNSCGGNTFGILLRKIFHELNKSNRAEALKACKSDSEKKAASKKFSKTLQWNFIVRRESFADLIEKMSKINSFECTLSALEVNEGVFSPSNGLAKRITQKFAFEKKAKLSLIVAGVKKFIKEKLLDDYKIVGEDDDGNDLTINMEDNLEIFSEYDFDDVADKMKGLRPADFSATWMMQEMQRVFNKNSVHFTVAAR